MSKRDLIDEDLWGFSEDMDIRFEVQEGGKQVAIMANDKYLGTMMLNGFAGHEGYAGISLMFEHLVDIESGVFATLWPQNEDVTGDCVDIYFHKASRLTYGDYLTKGINK